jgi:hypothetical protein
MGEGQKILLKSGLLYETGRGSAAKEEGNDKDMEKQPGGVKMETVLPKRRPAEHLGKGSKDRRRQGLPPKPGPVLIHGLAAGQESFGNEKRGPAGFGGRPCRKGGRKEAGFFYMPAKSRREAGQEAGQQDKEEESRDLQFFQAAHRGIV